MSRLTGFLKRTAGSRRLATSSPSRGRDGSPTDDVRGTTSPHGRLQIGIWIVEGGLDGRDAGLVSTGYHVVEVLASMAGRVGVVRHTRRSDSANKGRGSLRERSAANSCGLHLLVVDLVHGICDELLNSCVRRAEHLRGDRRLGGGHAGRICWRVRQGLVGVGRFHAGSEGARGGTTGIGRLHVGNRDALGGLAGAARLHARS